MKRLLAALTVVLLSLACASWIAYRYPRSRPASPPSEEENNTSRWKGPPSAPAAQRVASDPSPKEPKVEEEPEPEYWSYGVDFKWKEEGKTVLVGFFKPKRPRRKNNMPANTFYAWKGVTLTAQQTAGRGPPSLYSGFSEHPLFLADARVVEVDPPVCYIRRADGKYMVGYDDTNIGLFFWWKGIVIRPEELPTWAVRKGRVLKPAFASLKWTIDPPAHMLAHPERWRKHAAEERNP